MVIRSLLFAVNTPLTIINMETLTTISIVWNNTKKVIFIGVFFALILQVFAWIGGKTLFQLVYQLVTLQINFGSVVAGVLSVLLFKIIFIKDEEPLDIYYTEEEKRLKKLNSYQNTQEGLLVEWEVNFQSNGKPYVENLALYCTKHNRPILLQEHKCPICDRKRISSKSKQIFLQESKIEPMLEDMWLVFHS